MATPFDHYPYTNFHELNLAYFIVHFREIFAEWETLYNNMVSWREQTDADLTLWKIDTLNAIEDYERDLTAAWDTWKSETALDIADWKDETLEALDAWKTAFQALFDSTFSNLSQIKTDAEAARDAAIAAQNRAEAAAETLTLDPTLTSPTQAAQAKAVGDVVDDLNEAVEKLADFRPIILDHWAIGGYNAAMNGLPSITATNRARIQAAYLVPIDTADYMYLDIPNIYQIRAAVYDRSNLASLNTILTDTYTNERIEISNSYAGKFIGITLRRTDDADISTEELNDLKNNIKFITCYGYRELKKENNILFDLYNEVEFYPTDVATSAYPTGWYPGIFDDSGNLVKSSVAICVNGRIGIPGGKKQREGSRGIKVTSPFGTIQIKRFSNGTLIDTIIGTNKEVFCQGTEGDLIAVQIIGLEEPSSDYIDNGDIANVHIFNLFGTPKKAGYTEKEFFTVSINKTWIDGNADVTNLVDVDSVLMLPKTYTPNGTPTRLIFMHHGNSGTVNVEEETWYSESSVWPNFITAYLNAGYAVFDVNGCGSVTNPNANHDYGAFGALEAAYKAYKYITGKYNIDKRIFVHGSSMGGATAYAFAKAYGSIVDAIGLFSPALLSRSAQMSSVYDYIAVNFGYSDRAQMIADDYSHLITANPTIFYYLNGLNTDKSYTYDWVNEHATDGLKIVCKDFNIPIKIWCGTSDTSVDPKYGEELAKAITSAGGIAIFRPIPNGNHNAGIGANATVNSEAVMWFNRFK